MLRMILRRLAQVPLVLAVIFLVTFTLAWLAPGNPLQRGEKNLSKQVEEDMRRKYHLDSPWSFMNSYLYNLARGDLGPSLAQPGRSVGQIIRQGLPASMMVGTAGLILALFLGLGAGVVGALRPGSVWDYGSLGIALVGISLPSFVTGTVLMAVFAGLLGWFPVQGLTTPKHLFLPALTLSLAPAAYIARLVRMGLAEVMGSDFIRTAQAKGLPPHRVLFDHAMKVAFLPVLSFLGPAAAATLTGSFVVERVFEIPGLGRDFVTAVLNKDQSLILGLVLVYSAMLILFNLAVDVAYAWVDPRIDLGKE